MAGRYDAAYGPHGTLHASPMGIPIGAQSNTSKAPGSFVLEGLRPLIKPLAGWPKPRTSSF